MMVMTMVIITMIIIMIIIKMILENRPYTDVFSTYTNHGNHHHHQLLTPAVCRDGYEQIVLGGLLSPLLPLVSVQVILCPRLYCLSSVVLVCLC